MVRRDDKLKRRAFRNHALSLHNDVAVLDVDWKGLGHIRAFRQCLAVLDHHWIGPDLDAGRIEIGLAVAHVEFPAMPGAAQQLADPRTLIDAGLGRRQPRHARRPVERRAFMRAAVEQREELAVDMNTTISRPSTATTLLPPG